jgi:hypothetical protein
VGVRSQQDVTLVSRQQSVDIGRSESPSRATFCQARWSFSPPNRNPRAHEFSNNDCVLRIQGGMTAYPGWLHIIAWFYLSLSFACSLAILFDWFRRPQTMMVMNVVWPITALYGGPGALWACFNSAPYMTKQHMKVMKAEVTTELQREKSGVIGTMAKESGQHEPTREQVAVATTHCGASCTRGDIVGEWN